MGTEELIAWKFTQLREHLDERSARLSLGVEALAAGPGGTSLVARSTGASLDRVSTGRREIENGVAPLSMQRRPGGGRKRVEDLDPGIGAALEDLVADTERGDPMTPLRWTTDSTDELADKLTAAGHRVGADAVGRLLKQRGYSLQANAKTLEGATHPDRDAQFRYIAAAARAALDAGRPVASVDCKKKERVGLYKSPGRTWRAKGDPIAVKDHDFPDAGQRFAKAVPYGVYDPGANSGWVSVGQDGDTAAFAVNTLRSWWENQGCARYPDATELLITADAGGSNGYRTRLWKVELANFAAETGLTVTVLHYPPGTQCRCLCGASSSEYPATHTSCYPGPPDRRPPRPAHLPGRGPPQRSVPGVGGDEHRAGGGLALQLHERRARLRAVAE